MARPLDSKRIVAEILAGQHDDDINDIFQAVIEVARREDNRVRWRIVWTAHDLTITEDDLTVEECLKVEEMTKVPWHRIDPLDTVKEAAAILTVALHARRDLPMDDAVKQVGALGARSVMDMVGKYVAEGSPIDSPTEALTS